MGTRAAFGRLFVLVMFCLGHATARGDNIDGQWSGLQDWPLIAIHAAITPDGRVLSYGTDGNGKQTGFFIYDIWDPQAGLSGGHVTLQNYTNTDLFCSSQIVLPQSGEIVIAGGDNWTGTSTTNTGNSDSSIFDYTDDTLVTGSSMHRARWYSSATALINGEIYIQGGNGGGDLPEVRQTDGSFRLLAGAPTGSYATVFPRNFLAPDGRVFGYDTNGKMFFVNAGGAGQLSPAGQFSSAYAGWTSGAAMFSPGRILQLGTNSRGVTVVDINGPEPVVTPSQSLSSQRHWVSATVLADGQVLATGGSEVVNTLAGVNNHAEIWNPDSGQWHVGAEGAVARLYHSSALLLPDASVLVAGGGAPGPLKNTNAEIYYPPYLFAADGSFAVRPQIESAPDTANVGDRLTIQVDSDIDRLTLVKTGSVTHSVNMDQRFLELPFSQSGNMLEADLPARASDTPPGFYLLFALDDAGVPSASSMLRINIDATPNVAVDFTPAIGGAGGAPFQLSCNTDEVLVGVHGNAATYVNQVGPQCVRMDQFGRWIGDPLDRAVTGTTTTGTAFSKTCPRDQAVSGFRGRAGAYLNQLDIACRTLTPAGGLTGSGQFLGPDGGAGGSARGPLQCGTENPAYAIYGRSGAWLDSFGMQCRRGVVTEISVNADPVIVNPGPQSTSVGQAVDLQIDASDSDSVLLTFSATGLPPGLGIDSDSGRITGAPTSAGSYAVEVTVTDGLADDTAAFGWEVTAAPPLDVGALPPQLPREVNTPIAFHAVSTGGVNPRYNWQFGDGSPDSGFSASPDIAHTFTSPGIYYVTLTVSDDTGATYVQTIVQGIHLPHTANRPGRSTNIAYEPRSTGNARVWVVNEDNDSVSVVDAVTRDRIAEIPVGKAPRSIAVAPDGRIWVSNKSDHSISIIDTDGLAAVDVLDVPYASQPHGIVFSPLADHAFVALEAANAVLRLDAVGGAQSGLFQSGAHPRHLAMDGAGSRLYVSLFVTPPQPGEDGTDVSTSSGGSPTGGLVQVVDSESLTEIDTIVLQHSERPDAENQGRGVPNYLGAVAVSPDGTHGRIPSKQDNIGRGALRSPPLNLNFQNTVRAISSRIDLASNQESTGQRIDHDDAGVSTAIVYEPYGIYAFVALETSREIAVVDAYASVELFRIDVGRAPDGLAVSPDGMTLYVNNFMDRTIDVIDLTQLQTQGQWLAPVVATVPAVGIEKLDADVLLGKQLFYDARDPRLAFDRYLSCASCHSDGSHDGRTWDLGGFGEGIRNTADLRGRGAGHGPRHWTANFDEVQDFEGQIRDLARGSGLMDDADFLAGSRREPLGDVKSGISAELDALAAYVNSLTEVAASPHRNSDASLTADAVQGRVVFEAQNCHACHGGPGYTDSGDGLHDIGTIDAASGQRLGAPLTGFDTPSLRGIWSSAPYLHDGSAATLADAVLAHDGVTLDPANEMPYLVAYLQQLDGNAPDAPAPDDPVELIVDNLDAATSRQRSWSLSSGVSPYAVNSVYNNAGGVFRWHPSLPESGGYDVYAWWTYHTSRSTSVPYRIVHDGGTATVTVNQRDDTLGGHWVLLGQYALTAGVNGEVSVSSENGQASADAVRLVLRVPAAPDTTAPGVPGNLAATVVSDSEIALNWDASSDESPNLAYAIYRDGNYGSAVGTVVNGTNYIVPGLAANTLYSFEVRATDDAGNVSGLSAPASATTLAHVQEAVVDNLDAATSTTGGWSSSSGVSPYAANSVYNNAGGVFRWHPSLPESGDYDVYAWWTYHTNRSTSVPYRIVHDGGTATVTVNQRDDTLGGQWVLLGQYALTAGVNGEVSVSSENGQASADAVRLVLRVPAAPDTTAPGVPGNLAATVVSDSEIALNWDASSDESPNLAYAIYRDGNYGSAVGTVVNGTNYIVPGLAANTLYSFEVRATDDAGNVSGLSAPASATTLAEVQETIVDNLDAATSTTGGWSSSSGVSPYAANSVYNNAGGVFRWHPSLPASGIYDVYAWWTYHSYRSTSVPYRIVHDGGTATVTVDQRDDTLGGQWVLLGQYALTAGVNGEVSVSSENGQASADAVRFIRRP